MADIYNFTPVGVNEEKHTVDYEMLQKMDALFIR